MEEEEEEEEEDRIWLSRRRKYGAHPRPGVRKKEPPWDEDEDQEIKSKSEPSIGREVHGPRLGVVVLTVIELDLEVLLLLIGSDSPEPVQRICRVRENGTAF